ncbi:MAG: ABC transporter permease [Anaerolineae bacterium]
MMVRSPATRTTDTSRQQVPPPFGFGPRGGGHPGMAFGQQARAKDARGTLHRLWGYLQCQQWQLVAVVVTVVVTTALGLLGPYLLGLAIDRFIMAHDLPGLARIVMLMLVSYAALSLVSWLQTFLMIRVAQRTVRDMRRDLFAKLQTLSLHFFDERTHGELMSRLTNDVENVNTVLTNSVTSFLSSMFTLAGVVAVMLAVNIPLALVSLIVVPLMAYLTSYIARHSRQGFRDQQASLGVLNGLIEETISGSKVIHAYGREQAVIADFDRANSKLREAAIRAQTYSGFLGPGGNRYYPWQRLVVPGRISRRAAPNTKKPMGYHGLLSSLVQPRPAQWASLVNPAADPLLPLSAARPALLSGAVASEHWRPTRPRPRP